MFMLPKWLFAWHFTILFLFWWTQILLLQIKSWFLVLDPYIGAWALHEDWFSWIMSWLVAVLSDLWLIQAPIHHVHGSGVSNLHGITGERYSKSYHTSGSDLCVLVLHHRVTSLRVSNHGPVPTCLKSWPCPYMSQIMALSLHVSNHVPVCLKSCPYLS